MRILKRGLVMKSHHIIPKLILILILFCTMILISCSNKGTTNNKTTSEELFDLVGNNHNTYKDIAPVEIPASVLNLNSDEAKDAVNIANDFNNFLQSPDAPPPKGKISKSISTECYGNGIGSVCIYTWKEDNLTVTSVDIQAADYWLLSIYYKGIDNDHTFPGDLNDPDDYGYLFQTHQTSKDLKNSVVTIFRYPDSPPEYADDPDTVYIFQAVGDSTIYTPWGKSQSTTYTYTLTMHDHFFKPQTYASDQNQMICKPNGNIEWNISTYSVNKDALYRWLSYFYDYSENKFTWFEYDEAGGIIASGP